MLAILALPKSGARPSYACPWKIARSPYQTGNESLETNLVRFRRLRRERGIWDLGPVSAENAD